jgi:hypothetical protein
MGEEDNNFGRDWGNEDDRAAQAAEEDDEDEINLLLRNAENPDGGSNPYDELIQRVIVMNKGEGRPSDDDVVRYLKNYRRDDMVTALVLHKYAVEGLKGATRAAELHEAMEACSGRMIDACQQTVVSCPNVTILLTSSASVAEKDRLRKEFSEMVFGNEPLLAIVVGLTESIELKRSSGV